MASEYKAPKRGLGRGLSALFGEGGTEGVTVLGLGPGDGVPLGEALATGVERRTVAISDLQPGRYQPRRRFDAEALTALTESIRSHGILQPLVVRPIAAPAGTEGERYEIIAGERRWRAAMQVPLHDVPVVVREFTDAIALEIALVENVQRADLTPIEEAEGYGRLIAEFEYTQDALSKVVGKSRSHVANMLRLLTLPLGVRAMLDDGRLTMGHARALITATDPEMLAKRIVDEQLTVREAERFAAGAATSNGKAGKAGSVAKKGVVSTAPVLAPRDGIDPDTAALERDLEEATGFKCVISDTDGRGTITIHYQSVEQFEDLIQRLSDATPPAEPKKRW